MVNKIIPYGRQSITEDDINVVVETLQSDFLTQGPKIKEFEDEFAKYVGSKYAVAVANGTAALHLSALAMGVAPGQKVITTPITFAASANCIRYCGGEITFCDIDPDTFLIDINKVREILEASPKGTYAGIIPVDFAGRAVNMEKLRRVADEFNLWIIEDSCHAPGGYFKDSNNVNQNCGSSKFADLAIFSFHPVKHIAAGEGGMITTDSETAYKKLLKLRTHGITKDTGTFQNSMSEAIGHDVTSENWPGWYMEMNQLGFNYRLTDFQAALGLSQLNRAEKGINRRREIAKKYTKGLSEISKIKRTSGDIEGHAYHLFVIEVEEDRLGLYDFLRKKGIYAQVHYIPTHLMPYYKQFGWKMGDFPVAEKYYKGCLSIPMYPTLTDEEVDYVISSVSSFYS